MFDLPFGLGGMTPTTNRTGSNSTTTQSGGQTKNFKDMHKGFQQTARWVQGGMNGAGGLGAMMGFMGLPWLSRNAGPGNSGHIGWVNPWDFLGGIGQFGKGGGGKGGGGNDDGGDDGGGDNGGGGNDNGNGSTAWKLQLLTPPPIGTGAQWRNTMRGIY